MKPQLLLVLMLTGCSTMIPVEMKNPYDFPKSLLEDCKEPELINPDIKFSEMLKIIVENNTRFAECRITKKALGEMIQQRKEIFDKSYK